MTGTAHELAEQIAAGMSIPPDVPMTDEQAAEFRERFEEAMRDGSLRAPIFLPPRPLLTPELARELLRECVTVARPGEVLAVRIPDSWSASDGHQVQQRLDGIIAARKLEISVLLLPGEEFAVAQPKPAPPAFMKDVREDVFRDETVAGVRLTHLPTGVTAEGPTQAEAVGRLAKHLFTRGHISVNTARSAYGLPPFDGDFADKPLEPRG